MELKRLAGWLYLPSGFGTRRRGKAPQVSEVNTAFTVVDSSNHTSLSSFGAKSEVPTGCAIITGMISSFRFRALIGLTAIEIHKGCESGVRGKLSNHHPPDLTILYVHSA
jgi:hypothetical protein